MKKLTLQEIKDICNNDKNTVFIICGVSGSGKTTFEERLMHHLNNYFFKLPQVTTRDRRSEADAYYFITEKVYEKIKPVLIAKIDNPEEFNSTKYGTIPVFSKNKINTIVASVDAIHELFSGTIINNYNTQYMMLLLDIDNADITDTGRRKDRSNAFLDLERKKIREVFEMYKHNCIWSGEFNFSDHSRFPSVVKDFINFSEKQE